MTPMAKKIIRIDKWDCIKLKCFCIAEETRKGQLFICWQINFQNKDLQEKNKHIKNKQSE